MAESNIEIRPATASINNEDQNTQKEADIPGGNEKKNDELVIEIRKMVEGPEIQSSRQGLIYKVLPQLRKWNEEAYNPQVISIGPIHHKNERLKAMEEHKKRFFRSFVRQSKIELEDLVRTIRKMEKSIRECYAETIDLSSDGFVKMILVDASFILEILRRSTSENTESPLVGFNGELPRAAAVMFDLLLLENQLPFFVIEKLRQLAFPSDSSFSNYNALLELSIKYFGPSYGFQFRDDHPNVEIDHFTDLLRTVQLPPPKKQQSSCNCEHIHLKYTASQLNEAGVKFEVGASECGLDIKFEKGVLKMPKLELNDWTEVVTRNIMALEQTCYIGDAHFTYYFFFMDLLINTREDVDLLCDKGILVNYLGDNEAAKSMINNLNKGIIWINMRKDYVRLCNELNDFYQNPWHRSKATLKQEYFSTPWRTASTFAAVILLLLTFIQTIFSVWD